MKRYVAVLSLLAGGVASSWGQPYLSVSPSLYDVPYTFNRFGNNVYILQRADQTHQSVRMLGLPPGFCGLVADPLSDWFRNPAYDVGAQSLQLYGAGDDRSQILGGAMTRLDRSNFGLFVWAGGLSDRTLQQSYLGTVGSSSSETTSGGTGGISQSLGACALYRLQLEEHLAGGLSYQFIKEKREETANASGSSDPLSTAVTDIRLLAVRSTVHAATLGLQLETGNGSLAVRTRLTRSTPSLHEGSQYLWITSGTRTQSTQDQTSDLRTTGILGGVEYRLPVDDAWSVHTLVELGQTTYDAPGVRLAESMYADSLTRSLASNRGNQSIEGKILDVRIGGMARHTVGQSFNMYEGLIINYAKHTSDQTQEDLVVEANPSFPTLTRTVLNNYNLTVRAFIIQIPVGAEYAFSSVLSFRGGIMPQYLSIRREWGVERAEETASSLSGAGTDSNKSLIFLTTMGLSLYDEDIGEIHIAYGANESGVRAWSLSARYIL